MPYREPDTVIIFDSEKKLAIFVCEIYGAIAQLGERLNGIQEVSGSIPLSSTKAFN